MIELSINTIRTLSMDAVQQAKSGHPGTPMALAPLVYTIWNRVMRFDPQDPIWPNRDRFVLSNGHASMLLWSVLHLTRTQAVNAEYERLGAASVTLDDIRRFRQLDSKAPGHPEYHWVSGVETTTGPLGQGVATSVGMAIAEKWLADRYNRAGFEIFDYHIYAVCGDGCMMEGIASEAASLAGHLGLDNLCWIYDNNHITIEGNTRHHVHGRCRRAVPGYGWNVLRVGDANDIDRIEHALEVFRKTKDRPTLIILDSHIGYGSPHKQDTRRGHGEPLGEEEVRLDEALLWLAGGREVSSSRTESTSISQDGIGKRGAKLARRMDGAVRKRIEPSIRNSPPRSIRCSGANCRLAGISNLPVFPADAKGMAGREASGKVLNVLAQEHPVAHRAGRPTSARRTRRCSRSTARAISRRPVRAGKNLHFGIREHAMAAIVNGLALSKLRAFGATFFIFSDYARPAIRLSALMELPTIFVFTHDAMGDGEDGPTHQPVEHLASLRAIPGLVVTCGPGMRTKWSRPIAISCSFGISRPCSCSRGSRCRRWTGASMRRRPEWRAAHMCSRTRREQIRK